MTSIPSVNLAFVYNQEAKLANLSQNMKDKNNTLWVASGKKGGIFPSLVKNESR